jgi:isopenicillin N synthase-like dioxygenase
MSDQPAVIDISGVVQGDPGALERAAGELASPCADWGTFHIVGHGIDPAALAGFEAAMRGFFDLSPEIKRTVRRSRDNARGYYDEELTKNRPDWKEVFDYGSERRDAHHSDGVNQWPRGAEAMRQTLLSHYVACERVALALLRALCVSLGLEPGSLDGAFVDHSSFVRLNRYTPSPDPAPPDAPFFPEKGHLGVHHHTDAGALTLLYQDDVAGLQMYKDGRFVLVEPVPGAFAVNLGDMLQIWSNDRYRAPLHRVLANATQTRYSAPFFLNPSYDAICEPLPGLLGESAQARFRAVAWSMFRDQRSAGDYANYGQEIQIEDFRIPEADPRG